MTRCATNVHKSSRGGYIGALFWYTLREEPSGEHSNRCLPTGTCGSHTGQLPVRLSASLLLFTLLLLAEYRIALRLWPNNSFLPNTLPFLNSIRYYPRR